MIDKKTFKKTISAPFEKEGFLKKGQSWYLEGKDAIIVTNFQKCDWGEYYFINIGIWLKAFGEASFPEYNHCPLSYRLESFFPQQRNLILLGCSLEQDNTDKLFELSEFIEIQVIPFLRSLTDVTLLKKLMANGRLKNGLVRLDAKWFLSEADDNV